MVYTVPMQHVTTTRWTADLEILDAEAVMWTALIRIHPQQLNLLVKIHCSLNFAPCRPPGRLCNKNCNTTGNHFRPLVNYVNRRWGFLPFLFSNQPPNHEIPSHSPSAPRSTHQYALSQPPQHCETPSMVHVSSLPRMIETETWFNTDTTFCGVLRDAAPTSTTRPPAERMCW